MRRYAEASGDFLRAKAAFLRELLEGLELVGGIHVLAGDVLIEADFVRIVRGIDDAADRLGLLDLLALHPEKLGKPPALTDGDSAGLGIYAPDCSCRLNSAKGSRAATWKTPRRPTRKQPKASLPAW